MKRPVKQLLRLRSETVRRLDLSTIHGGIETDTYDLTDHQGGGCCPPWSLECLGAGATGG
jgi:hypothetical protein